MPVEVFSRLGNEYEAWLYLNDDGSLRYHGENNGHSLLRKGLEPHNEILTVAEAKTRWPELAGDIDAALARMQGPRVVLETIDSDTMAVAQYNGFELLARNEFDAIGARELSQRFAHWGEGRWRLDHVELSEEEAADLSLQLANWAEWWTGKTSSERALIRRLHRLQPA